jgi:hypothetical protein
MFSLVWLALYILGLFVDLDLRAGRTSAKEMPPREERY